MRVIGLTDLRRYLLAKSIDQPRRLTMTHCGDEEFTFGNFYRTRVRTLGNAPIDVALFKKGLLI